MAFPSTGVTALVSHAIGRHDHQDASKLVTHGITLTLGITFLITVAGYLSIDPVFRWLGANETTLPLVRDFMRIWYLGALFMSLPWMGNGILISAGDSRAASRFMILGTLLNALLNPVMIFGLLGFPALGIRGSALATVVAQAVSTVWLFVLLSRKHKLLTLRTGSPRDYLHSFRRIFGFAIPSILSMALMPISASVITSIVSGYGNEAVAACGAAGRLEMFAFVIPMALGISLTPFMSQNHGANRLDRIREALKVSTRFALAYGGCVAVVFYLSAPWLAAFFSEDQKVVEILSAYIRIICFGYGMLEVHRYCGFTLTGLHEPVSATVLNAIRVLALLIPLSYVGAHCAGVRGVFAGRLITDIIAGSIGLVWVSYRCRLVPDGQNAREVAPVAAGPFVP
ncbi:MAG: MATE family efflux transporter [Planctomycetota bacterium]|nr:MATE family efflux transporter [Planctomycetota bacterium]